MSLQHCLCTVVHERLHEAFGKPRVTKGRGRQWTLHSEHSSRLGMHVLLKGSAWSPVVWIFDPHDPSSSCVENTIITDAGQIAGVILNIQRRLSRSPGLGHERTATDTIIGAGSGFATRSDSRPRHGWLAGMKAMLRHTSPTLVTRAHVLSGTN